MALTKRVYVDGETIITADNLNAIQDEIISQGVNKVPTGRKINDNPLTSDINLTASSVGAAPTAHASSNTTYGKGTNSNYGHVKLTDALDSTAAAASGGTALSAKAGADLKSIVDKCTFVGSFSNSSDIKTQVDALGDEGYFFGKIASPSTSYFPLVASGIVYVYSYSSGYKSVFYKPNGASDVTYMLPKSSTWRTWVKLPTRSEIDTVNANLASVDSGTTASRAYAVGEYVNLNGVLYIVTAAISSGGTFTVGTNIVETTIAAAITPEEPTVTASTTVTWNKKSFYKTGRIVNFTISLTNSSNIATNTTLVSGLPIPPDTQYFLARNSNDGTTGVLYINTSGQLRNSGAWASAGSWIANGTYISASL